MHQGTGHARRRRLLLSLCLAAAALAPPHPGEARVPFPQATLRGTPYTVGQQHGRAFRRQIKRNVAFYLDLLQERGMSRAVALRQAGCFAPVLARHTPALLREMEGIARGAGCTRNEILLLNARTELLSLAQSRLATPGAETPGCTSLALARGKQQLVLAQNWDWRPSQGESSVLLRIERKGAPSLVTFTEAGMVGKIGLNEHRLGVCLNFLSHQRERSGKRAPGLPIHVLLRAAMECRTTAEAERLIRSVPRSASGNIMLAQPTPRGPCAVDLETAPGKVARIEMRTGKLGGALVHTNHFRSRSLSAGCQRRDDPNSGHRLYRAWLRSRSPDAPADPVQHARQILADRSQPYPISRTKADRQPGLRSDTVASIVMDLGAPRPELHLTRGPGHLSAFVRCAGPAPRR